jgi:predicted ATP-binding protein involved in virulence
MFKLLKLEITNHAYFGDISLNFVDEEEEPFGPYTTLVIGPNGTGKSQILASIIEILNYLSAFKVRDKLYHKFEYSVSARPTPYC